MAEDIQLTESDLKALALTSQLQRGRIYVTLDARRDGVVVPPEFAGDSKLTLLLGKDLPVPIPDLVVDNAAVTATLSFNQQPFHCTVPWEAIYALSVDGVHGMIFKQSLPEDVALGPTERPKLGVVDGGKTEVTEPLTSPRPSLKLV